MWSLKHRLVEHQHALWNEYVPASALAEHTLSTGHLLDLSKSEGIECHLYVTTYCPWECWRIQCHPVRLNGEPDWMMLDVPKSNHWILRLTYQLRHQYWCSW